MKNVFPLLSAALLSLSLGASAQEASSGLSLPVTVSGNARFTKDTGGGEPASTEVNGGFRATISPSLRLGNHWFAYAVLNTQSSSYLDYESSSLPDSAVSAEFIQAYVGYKKDFHSGSVLIKAGRLASAFGLYPLEYDDATSPLIEPPPVYVANLPLRPDQLPCGVHDVIWQTYGDDVQFNCGGSSRSGYGLTPVTLYGIPGFETQLSWRRLDARLQITNSSPANPQSLLSRSQFGEWTAGGGYTFHEGLHVGISGFRGPYLDHVLEGLLPPGKRLGDYFASGIGVDLQWLHGSWSVSGEWQQFRFDVPGFAESPSVQAAYGQVKRILTPRAFVAFRAALELPGAAKDSSGHYTPQLEARQETEEAVLGYRINRMQLLKIGFENMNGNDWALGNAIWPARHTFGLEIQLVNSFNALSKAF